MEIRSKPGCCEDGRQCDGEKNHYYPYAVSLTIIDLCVEIAAAYLCRQEHIVPKQIQGSCLVDCCMSSNPNLDSIHDVMTGPQIAESDATRRNDDDNQFCCGGDDCDEAEVGNSAEKNKTKAQCCVNDEDPIPCCTVVSDSCTNSISPDLTQEHQIRPKTCGSADTGSHEQEDECKDNCCAVSKHETTTKSPLTGTWTDCCGAANKPITAQDCFLISSNSVSQATAQHMNDCGTENCCDTKSLQQTVTKPMMEMCCVEDSSSDLSELKKSCSSSGSEYEPCAAHLEAAFRQFTGFLEAGFCICRNVLAKTDVCCDEKKRAAASRARARRQAAHKTKTCANSPTLTLRSSKLQCRKRATKASCYLAKVDVGDSTSCAETHIHVTSQSMSRLSKEQHQHAAHITGKNQISISHDEDPGQNPATHEHVAFKIDGMDCSGCAKQITGLSIPGIFHIYVNFVAGRGDCYLDTQTISPSQALQQLERKSGFKCVQIISHILTLDLLMTEEQSKRLEHAESRRIHSVKRLQRGLYQVSFDPSIVGARTVLSVSHGTLAPPRKDDVLAEGRRKLSIELLLFLTAAIFTVPVVVLSWGNITTVSYDIKSTICLVLGTFVQAVAVPEFYIPALKALFFSKTIEMDMLVVISITAAYGYSVVAYGMTHAGYILREGEFFETSTLLITLVILGRLLSAYAKVRAVNAVSLRSLQSGTTYLCRDADQDTREAYEIDARLLEYDDMIKIPPHACIVTDGEVVRGTTTVDESMLTGESIPVPKSLGSIVIAGTNNGAGQLIVRATRLPGQNSISDIANLVTDAMNTKPRIQDLADSLAGHFVPVVMCVATVVFIIWLLICLKVRHENAGGAIGTSITYAIAVLAITCPCALGLAVPLVLVVAGGVAAKAGIVIKSASSTERSHTVTDVVFDKTGTLTSSDLYVVHEKVTTTRITEEDIFALTLSLIEDNQHPVSRAVTTHLRSSHTSTMNLTDIASHPGAGVQAKWNTKVIKAGNPAWLGIESHPVFTSFEGLTLLCVTLDSELMVVFGLSAIIRPEAARVINQLQIRNIQCHIVSGDNRAAVTALAARLDIPEHNIRAHYSPEQKRNHIQTMQSSPSDSGSKRRVVFIGDGTNDAGAIAQADVGVQIGDTSDVSRAAADVVLLGGLDGIITLLNVSKAAYRRIMFNFVWSGVYNVFAILLASGAFVRFRVPPAYAGLGEIVSVLPVILVALSLVRVNLHKA